MPGSSAKKPKGSRVEARNIYSKQTADLNSKLQSLTETNKREKNEKVISCRKGTKFSPGQTK